MSFSAPLAAFVRTVIGPLSRFAQHPAKVVSQAADGSVSVRTDSDEVPPLDAVPLTLGVPGLKVKVGPGTRVRLSFASGNPATPEVSLWEGEGLLELELDASVKVVLKAPQVLLGGPAPGFSAALGERTDARLDALEAAFNSHVHPTAAVGPPSVPLPVPGVIPVGVPPGSPPVGSVSSSSVKVTE
ncbi:hypothetical protein [Myxococcus phage Mx4 ts27htf-1hrm-1]|nr:hypothetical protein Mx4_p62 [Myxococcus phage Mx4]WNM70401.1 hypothetical protein [Myxococcus phage Mx4 ts27htf-1hrm-1]